MFYLDDIKHLSGSFTGIDKICVPKLSLEEEAVWLNRATNGAEILIIDSYTVSDGYIDSLNKNGRVLVCFDDNALYKYSCDIVLNGNLYAKDLKYRFGGKRPHMLLGGEYAPLRREFTYTADLKIHKKASTVFVCFGGSDLRNLTPPAVRTLQTIDGIKINAVLGRAAICIDKLRSVAGFNTEIHINPANIAEIMSKSDIGVISAGSVSLEAAALGLPSIMIEQAGNQHKTAGYMADNGFMEFMGKYDLIDFTSLKKSVMALLDDFDRRKREHKALKSAVSKNGADNTADEIIKILKIKDIL